MKINRRSALKQLFVISAGVTLLPACVNNQTPSSDAFSLLSVDKAGEETLTELAATFIPTTNTPGATEVGAAAFAVRMVKDCYKEAYQQKFVQGLGQFSAMAKNEYSKTFKECNGAERKALLTKVAAITDKEDALVYFHNTFKRLTIQAFTNSEYYLTKVDPYKLVPGKFKASVKV